MGFENLFFRGQKKETPEVTDEDELDERGKLRRKLLLGTTAMFAGQMLHIHGAEASDVILPEYAPIESQEDREKNVEKIFEYAQWIKANEEKLSKAKTKEEIMKIILSYVPALTESVLKDTQLDVRNTLEERGWPSKLFTWSWNNENNEKTNSYAQRFSVNNLVLSARHVFKDFAECSVASTGADLAGCPIPEASSILSGEEMNDALQHQIMWDPENTEKDFHGKIVFIPSTRLNSAGNSFTEVVPAVLVKVTPNFLFSDTNTNRSFFDQEETNVFAKELQDSYLAVIAPVDADENGIHNAYDIPGMSGGPVLDGEKLPQGIQSLVGDIWGAVVIPDGEREVSVSLALISGSKAIGDFMEQMGANYDSESLQENFDTVVFIKGLQNAINVWRTRHHMDMIDVDGSYGEDTAKALYALKIREFHIKEYPPTVDEQTWNVLFPDTPFEEIDLFLR